MKKYFLHKPENLLIVDRIVTVHDFEFDKNFVSEGEYHDFWELVHAEKGNIVCTAGDRKILLHQGETIFHKPNEYHALRADGKTAPNVIIVSFGCKSDAVRFFENRIIPPEKFNARYLYAILQEAKKTFDIPYSDPALKKMELLPFPTLGGRQLIKNYLEILLVDAMRALTETENGNSVFLSKEEFESKPVKDMLKIMRDKTDERLSADEICAAAGYSRSYAFREFKKSTGKSVMEYFQLMKIDRAKVRLREGEMTVREISDSLAFDTPNYFSKTFKKHTGLTPTAYKKRCKRL